MIPFLPPEKRTSNDPAILDDDGQVVLTYRALWDAALRWSQYAPDGGQLCYLYTRNHADDVAALLGLMAAGHAVALLDSALPAARRDAMATAFRPDTIIDDATKFAAPAPNALREMAIHPSNAVLLSTSGSTGTAKFVRLSRANLESNAHAIADVLDIQPNETGCAHLPMHYSYGLSVITSHLTVGAPIWLTQLGFMHSAFWKAVRRTSAAHIPGVPYHYQMLLKLGLARVPLDGVRVLTQAGGFLDIESRKKLWTHMDAKGGYFQVLYGQTEAAPRITTLAHIDFPAAQGSVGCAVPGGAIQILDDAGNASACGQDGMVVYHGPNVMLGYAANRDDLMVGDVQNGVLVTGDIGHLDANGRLFLTGRTSSFAKILGLRVNIDDLETLLQDTVPLAIVARDDQLIVAFEHSADDPVGIAEIGLHLKSLIHAHSSIPHAALRMSPVNFIPRSPQGKVDRQALLGLL